MQKVRISNYSDGSDAYTFVVNPETLDLNDNIYYSDDTSLRGVSHIQLTPSDGRPMKMTWSDLNSMYYTGWATDTSVPLTQVTNDFHQQVKILKAYRGLRCWMHLGDIDYQSRGWFQVEIIDVEAKLLKGAQLAYESVVLTFKEV